MNAMKNTSSITKSDLWHLAACSPAWLATSISKKQWIFAPHLQLIDRYIMEAVRKGSTKIMINMPPRHGKSEFISKYLPFWYLGNYPDNRIILASYGGEFASSWGKKVKEMIEMYGNLIFGIGIDKSLRSSHNFKIKDHSGSMNCIGALGQITGKGADLMIIDDPVKNDAEANSSVYRDNIWQWFTTTAYTRLEPKGILIIVMTRWHEDDLCGRVIRKEGKRFKKNWIHLELPAIADEKDRIGREKGESLWPERYSKEKLEDIRKTMGNYWFAALYQQRPAPQDGAVFNSKYFKYFDIMDGIYDLKESKVAAGKCPIYAVIDLAVTVNERSDYTVIMVFAVTPQSEILLLDLIRQRIEGAEHLNLVKHIYQKWRPISIGIESVQYQIALVQSARREGIPVKELKPDKDKLSRALAIAARMEAGLVYFKDGSPWLEDLERELLNFPNSGHDDQVDAFAYTVYMISNVSRTLPSGIKNNKKKSRHITSGFKGY